MAVIDSVGREQTRKSWPHAARLVSMGLVMSPVASSRLPRRIANRADLRYSVELKAAVPM